MTGSSLLLAMVLLWAGSVVHDGEGDPSDPADLLADTHAYGSEVVLEPVLNVPPMAFVIAAVEAARSRWWRSR